MSSLTNFLGAFSLPSGLHSYAGDASRLKVRILFTNDEILFRRPNVIQKQEECESHLDDKEEVNTGSKNEGKNNLNQNNNSCNNNNDNSNNNFNSSYLIKKVGGKWIVESEGSFLMEDVEDERFELRVLREPLLSRNCNCKRGTCSQESGSHEYGLPSSFSSGRSKLVGSETEEASKRANEAREGVEEEEGGTRNDLFGSFKMNAEHNKGEDVIRGREESAAASGCLPEKVKLNTASSIDATPIMKATTTTTTETKPRTNGSSVEIGLTMSKSAFHWKDTFTVTSGSQSNMTNDGINSNNGSNYDRNRRNNKRLKSQNRYYQQYYQKRTLARKLPIEMRNLYDYSSYKNLTSFTNVGSCLNVANVDNDIYHAQNHSLLSRLPKVATILGCSSLLLSDRHKEIASDQETSLNHETAREIVLRSGDKRNVVSLSDLYLRWLLLNERLQLKKMSKSKSKNKSKNKRERRRRERERISTIAHSLLVGQKQLALAERDDKFDNLLARSSVDDIVDGLKSAATLIESASVINQLARGVANDTSPTTCDDGGNLKAIAHLKQHEITGYLSSTTTTCGGGGSDTTKLQHISVKTSSSAQQTKMEEESKKKIKEQKRSEIRLNVNNHGEAPSEARKKSIIIDERCGTIEKLLNSRALIDPTGSPSCCSHGEILFIMMEKHMTTSLISGEGESSISERNFKRTNNSADTNGNTNNASSNSSPTLPSLRQEDAILEGKMISKEVEVVREEAATAEVEVEAKEGNENGNTDLKVQNQLGKLMAVKHHNPSSSDRSDRSIFLAASGAANDNDDDDDDGESIFNQENTNDYNRQQHITLADNNGTMPDEIGGGVVGVVGGAISNSSSSSFAADKINPNFDSRRAGGESSNKLIISEQKRKINQTSASSSSSIVINADDNQQDYKTNDIKIDKDTNSSDSNTTNDDDDYDDTDTDNQPNEPWMQQERQLRRQRQQCRQSVRQKRCLNPTTSQDNNSQKAVVCLGVIVIDTLNKFIQLKPDLNKLISLDVCQGSGFNNSESTSLGRYNGIKAGEAADRCRQLNWGYLNEPSQLSTGAQSDGLLLSEGSQCIPLSSLVYQLELVEEAHRGLSDAKLRAKDNMKLDRGRAEADYILNFVREQLLAPNFLSMTPSKPLDQFRASEKQQQVSKKASTTAAAATIDPSNAELNSEGFLTPVGGSMLIKLQFTIHFASDFPKDCCNLHVKYKLFSQSKSNSKWRLRIRRKALKRMKDDADVDGSLVLGINRDRNKNEGIVATTGMVDLASTDSRQEMRKVAQMSHLLNAKRPQGKEQQQLRSSTLPFSATSTYGDEFEKPSTKSTVFNGHHKQTVGGKSNLKDDVHNSNEALMAEHDNTCSTLLLEGSTITSRSNYRGVFHFNCIEELVLECIEANKWSSNKPTPLSLMPKTMCDSSTFTSSPRLQQPSSPALAAAASSSVLIQTNHLAKQHETLDSTTKEVKYDVLTSELDDNMTSRELDENNSTASTRSKTLTSHTTSDGDKAHDNDEKATSWSLLKGTNNSDDKSTNGKPVVGTKRQSKLDNTDSNPDDADENKSPANERQLDFVELSPKLLLGSSNIAKDTEKSRADNKDRDNIKSKSFAICCTYYIPHTMVLHIAIKRPLFIHIKVVSYKSRE